ncbi:MAG: hypothetical protein RL095_3829 [Verrucomicrobiota bacterium]
MNPKNNGLDAAFLCPHCKGLNQAPETERNTLMSCGHCDQPVAVPGAFTAPGSVLDEYVVKERLGSDGFCDLFRAYHPALDRFVVLKVMLRCRERTECERFVQAARIASRLSHPGIAGVQAVGIAGDCPWAAMEFVDGKTLKSFLDRDGSFAEADVRFIGVHLAKALAQGAAAGLLHGALMPSRVAISHAGDVKLFDLGMSREDGATPAPGTPLGEEDFYAPPERLRGSAATAAGDIYSLGAILYHCLSGRRLFEEERERRGLEGARLHKAPAFAAEDQVSPEFEALILEMLDKNPAARPDAATVTAALRQLPPPKASKRPLTLSGLEPVDLPEPVPRSSQSLKVKISTAASLSSASGRNPAVKTAKKRPSAAPALGPKVPVARRQLKRKRHSSSGRRKGRSSARPAPPAASGNGLLIASMAGLIIILLVVVLAMAVK